MLQPTNATKPGNALSEKVISETLFNLMRDAKGAQIYEGTNQIHRGIVAEAVLGRARA